ncbi:lipid IV(A) 3-deoxy-D-manno-octulosonic acid transferase [Thiothrix lacustris]|uniref:3-deoxy-D-manno-octulosonic acid transferase n=1 Tax=Thiothrix lacustris TaxID=525917 RepID=A0ABY9MTC8_9GAMM|nr:lipid IV(A) 3-deoxy-D-manno-octulosonic acid transferase [Thiothrix lacustris]WML91702.1 lipid IV(A) 3-deoxy-D-manno-octulosonic acid transferase [Thiothrix lacustris]
MRRSLYTALMYLLSPLFILRLLWRSRANSAYRQRIAERFGFGTVSGSCIWLHAVSVGETIAARPLVERLLKEFPQHTLLVTTTTPTGSDTVKRLFGERVKHCYLPYDLPGSLARLLGRVQPTLLVVMETEIWPNLYAACAQRNIPLLLANARLSERSVRGYARLGQLVRETLANVSLIAARGGQDAFHFLQLGAYSERVVVCGNIKFDLQVPAGLVEQGQQLRQQWGASRPVWVAASTHQGEDEMILRVFARLREVLPDLLLIVVPRHPERFDAVARLCADSHFPSVRRSTGSAFAADTAIIVGDSMGEMLLWYASATLAFIGGSLVAHGGHNPLEAAAFGLPVVSGVHVHNFADIFPPLCEAGGAKLVANETELYAQLLMWLQHNNRHQQAGVAAHTFFEKNQGALDCLMQSVRYLMKL